jgi:predicted NAD/FAD-dependent oxidoreductase
MGWRSRSLLGRDDETVVAELRKEMRRLGVSLPRPAWQHVVAREHATAIPEPGFTRRLRSLAAFRHARTFLAGDWLTGTSTVEGAVRSGQAAARAVLAVRA